VNEVQFELELDKPAIVSLYLYDVKGRLTDKVLHQVSMTSGKQQIDYDLKGKIAPGTYTYSVNIGGVFSSGKLMVLGE